MDNTRDVTRILDIQNDEDVILQEFRTGCRTRAVVATGQGVRHRYSSTFEQVVVKLYKGNGATAGSREYQVYHATHFHQIPALNNTALIQKSIAGGVFNGVGPYSVVEFIEGVELADRLKVADLSTRQARHILQDILGEIWIPLWHAGLRFKDCHPGNFVLTSAGKTVMIDTEQMRKDANELLHRQGDWSQRDRHEQQGLKRLPGLIQAIVCAAQPAIKKATALRTIKLALERDRHEQQGLKRLPGLIQAIVCAAQPAIKKATALRTIKLALESSQFHQTLAALGRSQASDAPARQALNVFMASLQEQGLLS